MADEQLSTVTLPVVIPQYGFRMASVTVGPGNKPVLIAGADPKRIYIAFGGNNAVDNAVSIDPDFVNNDCFITLPLTGIEPFEFGKVGPLCQAPWYGVNLGGATEVITVLTVSRTN